MPIDYVSELEARLKVEKSGTRFLRGESNVIFVGRTPSEVTNAVNEAMRVVVAYYEANLKGAPVRVSKLLVSEASLKVSLSLLYGCSVRNEPLVVRETDLDGMFCRGDLLWFCQENFGRDYRDFAAAMMGLDAREFALWEEGWERYVNK
jgi:hypothetical protein